VKPINRRKDFSTQIIGPSPPKPCEVGVLFGSSPKKLPPGQSDAKESLPTKQDEMDLFSLHYPSYNSGRLV
jgi:hypothetical protein